MLLKNFDDNEIIIQIYNNKKIKRYLIIFIGVLMQALAFSIFMLQYKLTFGISGLAIMIKKILLVNPAYTIFIANILLIIVSLIYLDAKSTRRTMVGAILYPLFIQLTNFLPQYIDLGKTEPVILALAGATLYGIGTGLVLKEGYTTGGTDVLKQLVSKYAKISLGQSTIYVDGVIVTLGLLIFGWQSFIYSILAIMMVGFCTDKVIIGISEYKTFQIVTTKEKEIKQYITNQLGHDVTILECHGGIVTKKSNLLICTIPTKEYFILKEGIDRIDKDAFFIITDTYEVSDKV